MKVLIFHGYLLHGTGSNVYNASLGAALVRGGHEVHLLCQDRDPTDLEWVDATADWDTGALAIEVRREPVRATVYRPDIGSVLPVYVADRYEGVQARPFEELSEAEVEEYLARNIAAVRDVVERVRPDVALANHAVMGPLVLARALTDVPYAVKIHGSALEYTVKPHPRFLPAAQEGVAGARGVLVGSHHTAESLWEALDQPGLEEKTRLSPPGVDVEQFAPRDRAAAWAGLVGLRERLAEGEAEVSDSSFARDPREGARALAELAEQDRIVVYVGKLIAAKGVDLLLEAWPGVIAAEPRARLVVVGFGAERARLEAVAAALDVPPGSIVWTGRLDHPELADLLPAAEAIVVPSVFPEAFGMVAAEGAACGALPIVAGHSGLAEVAQALAAAVPEQVAGLLAFPLEPSPAQILRENLVAWLTEVDPPTRAQARAAMAEVVRERWSWDGVARAVIAAAQGLLDDLPRALASPSTDTIPRA